MVELHMQNASPKYVFSSWRYFSSSNGGPEDFSREIGTIKLRMASSSGAANNEVPFSSF